MRHAAPMDHLDAELAQQFLHDALPADVRIACAQHLAQCQACRDLLDAERRFSSLMRLDSGMQPARARLPAGEIEAIVARGAPALARRWRWLPMLAAVTALASLAGAVYFVSRTPDERARVAARLGISPQLHSEIVAAQAALAALRQDPWIADDYETVVALDRLLTQEAP